ncbi:hypothetical protein [Alkaliphilus peptidifermentans]|uniref:Uncharacterized protein n=1 Tax=Alkaliphilus peptidifermentans DSM 18978 TaxID=1120976 RepID=A0A1G5BTU5_9FIRM|nr:hypothetical protein [Alkaliphilus peptidifermentans]SCX93496.1 hypothetical protein SAMN03080606_00518 [Alkaliphilus peptidifermentans DSM 18978]
MLIIVFFILVFYLISENNKKIDKLARLIRNKDLFIENQDVESLLKLKSMGLFNDEELERITAFTNLSTEKETLIKLYSSGLLSREELLKKVALLSEMQENNYNLEDSKLHILRNKLGNKDVVRFAEDRGRTWMCVCGSENRIEEKLCKECLKNQKYILENCTKDNI